MTRKIFGTIRNEVNGGLPVPGLKVQAWDDDWPEGDDFMGEDITSAKGQYEIAYSDGHWDSSIGDLNASRPDIYITVSIKNSSGKWIRLGKSQVFKDHDLSIDLPIDLNVDIHQPVSKKLAFLPKQHGFHFINNFTLAPDILGIDLGKWEMGFCGGMCAGAMNRFVNHIPVPPDKVTPVDDTPLFEELYSRQIKSTPPDLLVKLYDWQSAPDVGSIWRKASIGQRTRQEWPQLKRELDNGRPVTIILIRSNGYFDNPTRNHQVLAIGYEFNPATRDLVIFEYDPNVPDVESKLSMSLGLPDGRLYFKDSSGAKTRGFLLNPAGPAAGE